MFDNYEKKEQKVSRLSGADSRIELDDDSSRNYTKIVMFAVLILVFFLAVSVSFIFYLKNRPVALDPVEKNEEDDVVFLPSDDNDEKNKNNQGDNGDSDLQAEKISLGQFYNEPSDDFSFEIALTKFDLPINVKSDVVNYYDVARKINLDEVIEDINKNGFAIIENPFLDEANDFYSSFRLLSEKNIPLLVTDDYLLYYYQNNLKEIYKRIEKDVFYYSIYDASKKLYEVADARYRNTVEETGISNDPSVEGQRMYLAYLAVILELLSPTDEQIDDKVELREFYFTSQEARKFDFQMPSYLYDDVLREVQLIREAKNKEKSPIFKYEKDYTSFKTPKSYEKKAKLHNFYLATEWIRSVFPLYYKNEACETCLVDQDDWLMGLVASSFMAKDLSDNQDIKNEWAKIYKIISFFSGLRQELTYLNYQEALVNSFGENYDLRALFERNNPEMMNNALKLKAELEKYSFKAPEGGYDRGDAEELKKVGLRLLQETYLPENYIYKNLTYPNAGKYLSDARYAGEKGNITYCEKNRILYRCVGVGLDILNLINPIKDNAFFNENANYENYSTRSSQLRSDINNLNKDDWHRNTFWLTLNMDKNVFSEKNKNVSLFYENKKWQDKLTNTSLASLLNLSMNEDVYKLANQEIVALNTYKEKNKYSYIEPDIYLINELIASTDMLYNYLYNLNVMEEAVLLKSDLVRLQDNLDAFKIFIEKELKGEVFDDRELQNMYSLLFEYELVESGDKIYQLPIESSKRRLTRSIDGIKMLIYVRELDGMKAFAIGPIFDYQEY